MRVSEIRTGDVARLHLKLADRPALANKCLAIISSAWRWAQKHDEAGIGGNPVPSVAKYVERRRERFLTADELGRLGDALREGETLGLPATPVAGNRRFQLDPYAVAAIRLLILTGARLREILRLRWEHVDFERGMIFLPDSKTGQKAVYLSAAALAVLSSVSRAQGNPFVIVGGRENAARADLKKPWTAVTRAAGLQGLRIHDLRHSFASIGAGASLGLPVIGRLLGHSQPATTARYAHLDADPLRRAVNTIGETILSAMDGRNPANVVRITR
jgi:integrase